MSEDRAVQAMSGVEGWFSEDEARLLYRAAADAIVRFPRGRIVEIGSHKGRSTVVLATAIKHASTGDGAGRVAAIDPYGAGPGDRQGDDIVAEFLRNVNRASLREHIELIRARSSDVDWRQQISFLFLDGLHDYGNVAGDYLKYSKFLPVGGFVAFHDYANPDYPGVRRFVNERLVANELRLYGLVPYDRRENTLVVTRRQPRLSIVIPTCGRESLARALESLPAAGLSKADEVLVVGDGPQPAARAIVSAFSSIPVRYFEHGPTRMVGAAQRQFAMRNATGTHLCFLDDDDIYVPNGLDAVVAEIMDAPDRVLLFKEESKTDRHPWGIVWKDREVRCGHVGTQGIVVPNVPGRLGIWGNRYEADYNFLRSTLDLYPDRDRAVVWVDRIIAQLY